MKSKLSINTFAVKNIRSRKKRYALMISGIILAMIFSSSILFFATSMVSSMKEMSKNSYGNCNMIFFNADEDLMRTAYEDKIITEYGFAHIIGYAETVLDDERAGVSIGFLDEKAMELSYISFLEGGYPQNDGEIALEKAALSRLNPDAKVGDTIKIKYYNRNGSEIAEDYTEKSYKLVGIARNKLSNINPMSYENDYAKTIPSAFVYSGAETELGGKESLCCYMNYNTKPASKTDTTGYGTFRDYMLEKGMERENWTEIYTDHGFYNTSTATSAVFAIILVSVMLIASCLGIVNTFNSNLKERKKQIGMLRTVGATKRQIITIFGREAFFISLISAPVSVAISYFLVKAATKLLGENFVFVPNFWVLVLCALFSVCCVMLASLIPLVLASIVSPVASIRDTQMMRKMKTKRIKTKKSFDMPSLLAKRNLIFFKGKQTAVSILLIITIVFSCLGFSYMNTYKDDIFVSDYDYKLSMQGEAQYSDYINITAEEQGYTENQKRDILLSPYVKNVNGSKKCTVLMQIDTFTDYLTVLEWFDGSAFKDYYYDFMVNGGSPEKITKDNVNDYFKTYTDEYLDMKQKYGFQKELFAATMSSVEENVIQKLENSVESGKINIDKINSGEEVILIAPEKVAYSMATDKDGVQTSSQLSINDEVENNGNYLLSGERDFKVGDKVDLSILTGEKFNEGDEEGVFPDNCERLDKTVTIGAIITKAPEDFYEEYYSYSNFHIFTTNSGMKNFSDASKYKNLNIYLNTDCNEEIDEEMNRMLETVGETVPNRYVYSRYDFQKENDQMKTSLFVSMVSIIILFLGISASIINNSLANRIRESKREMGTLRAVGATQRDLVNSYIRQLLSMFGWGYGIGFGVFIAGYIVFILAYRSMHEGYEGVPLNFSIWQTLIVCLVLLAVCSINLWLKIRKEMKNSIIENIREL